MFGLVESYELSGGTVMCLAYHVTRTMSLLLGTILRAWSKIKGKPDSSCFVPV